jgi:hypothetical protein
MSKSGILRKGGDEVVSCCFVMVGHYHAEASIFHMWHLVTRRHWEEKSPTLAVRNFSDLNAPVSADELQSLAAAEKGLHNMLSALKLNGACRDRMLVQISKMINRKELNSGMHKANWQACFQEAASGWCQLLLARRSFENTPRRCIACARGAMFDQLCIHKGFKDGIICINKETEWMGSKNQTKGRKRFLFSWAKHDN